MKPLIEWHEWLYTYGRDGTATEYQICAYMICPTISAGWVVAEIVQESFGLGGFTFRRGPAWVKRPRLNARGKMRLLRRPRGVTWHQTLDDAYAAGAEWADRRVRRAARSGAVVVSSEDEMPYPGPSEIFPNGCHWGLAIVEWARLVTEYQGATCQAEHNAAGVAPGRCHRSAHHFRRTWRPHERWNERDGFMLSRQVAAADYRRASQ